MKLLELLHQGKRIINVDESWLNETSFLRRKWRLHGSTNSAAGKQVQPRISVIVAFDSHGEVHLTLTQVNTDNQVMALYLTWLAG